jgi:hypothetical protein
MNARAFAKSPASIAAFAATRIASSVVAGPAAETPRRLFVVFRRLLRVVYATIDDYWRGRTRRFELGEA